MILAAMVAWLALAPSPEHVDALAHCDHVALEGPAAERDYFCYATLARKAGADVVLDHLDKVGEDHPDDGRLWLTIGSTQADFGRDPTDALLHSIRALERADLQRYEIQARLNLARWFSNANDPARAKAQLTAAREASVALGHPLLTAIVEFDTLGEVARRFDADLLTAYDRAREAFEALPEDAPAQVRRSGSHNLARGARTLGNHRRAAAYAELSAETSEAAGDRHSALHAWRAAAMDRYRLQRASYDPHAIATYRTRLEELLADARAHDNPMAEISIQLDLARTKTEEARTLAFRRCLDIALRLDLNTAACKAGLASALATEDPEHATALADDLLGAARSEGSASATATAHAVRARIALAADDRDAAWSSWSSMLDAAEQVTAEQGARGRPRIHARWSARYRWVSGVALRWAAEDRLWFSRAFEAMERMRGRELAEFAGVGSASLASTSRTELSVLQRQLPRDTAMLVYQVGAPRDVGGEPGGSSWLLVITRERLAAYPLPSASVLDPAAAMVAAHLAGTPSDSGRQAAAALHDTLLGAALAELPDSIRALVILPDRQLHRLPFAALAGSDGRPLFERFATSVASSGTAWARLQTGDPLPRQFLAFADPDPPSGGLLAMRSAMRGRSPARAALGRLPGARAESRFAAGVLGGDAKVLLDGAASESALRSASAHAIVHIGAHVVVDGVEPANTRLVLAADANDDGYMFLEDLASLDLQQPLVVLAACEGADGELLAGEGPLSAVRALQLAGARTVVAGLWPVDDAQAAPFFAAFYEALDTGSTVAAALGHAQRTRRDAGAPASSWAGFVVYGDGGLTLGPRRGVPPWVWAALAALLSAAAVGATSRLISRRTTRS